MDFKQFIQNIGNRFGRTSVSKKPGAFAQRNLGSLLTSRTSADGGESKRETSVDLKWSHQDYESFMQGLEEGNISVYYIPMEEVEKSESLSQLASACEYSLIMDEDLQSLGTDITALFER